MLRSVTCFFVSILLFPLAPLFIGNAHAATYDWSRVAIGGGGWFTGILFHPQSKASDMVLYCRGDLAGPLRWDAANSRWINLQDSLPTSTQFVRGCDGLAVDPSEKSAQTLYGVFGEYDDQHNYEIDDGIAATQGLYKSTDRGNHWTQILNKRAGSNEDSRWCGEPVAVDPKSGGKVVFYGTRLDGLWISENADAAPADIKFAASTLPSGEPHRGVRCIVFDPSTDSSNTINIDGINRTKNVFAALPKRGVYGSQDGGQTWSLLKGLGADGKDIKRMVVLSDGSLVVAWEGPLSRYANGTWTPIGPGVNAVAQSPSNLDELIIGGDGGAFYHSAFYTTSDGKTVTPTSGWSAAIKIPDTAKVTSPNPWADWNATGGVDCLAVNPANPGEVWCTGVYGAWMAENIKAGTVNFVSQCKDLEIAVATSMVSPVSGENKLILGCGDVRGFIWKDLTAFPKEWIQSDGTCNYGVSASAGDPSYVVRVNANSPWEGFSGSKYMYSTDGGGKWETGSLPVGSVGGAQTAVGCDSNSPHVVMLVSTNGGNDGLYYADQGFSSNVNWAKATANGFPSSPGAWGVATLQADKKEPKNFYFAYTPEKDQAAVWVSTDSGQNWTVPDGQGLPSGNRHPWAGNLSTSPSKAGELYVSLGPEGLYCSTDAGSHFTQIKSVTKVRAMTTGLPRRSGGRCAVYVLGAIQTGDTESWGLFLSEDSGQSWTKLTTDTFQIPGGDYPALMCADGQVFGRIYVADGNTGIICGTIH